MKKEDIQALANQQVAEINSLLRSVDDLTAQLEFAKRKEVKHIAQITAAEKIIEHLKTVMVHELRKEGVNVDAFFLSQLGYDYEGLEKDCPKESEKELTIKSFLDILEGKIHGATRS